MTTTAYLKKKIFMYKNLTYVRYSKNAMLGLRIHKVSLVLVASHMVVSKVGEISSIGHPWNTK